MATGLMTPEDWIMAFMTHLTETGQPLDDYQDETSSSSYLIGTFLPFDSCVPQAKWRWDGKQAELERYDPFSSYQRHGARFVITI